MTPLAPRLSLPRSALRVAACGLAASAIACGNEGSGEEVAADVSPVDSGGGMDAQGSGDASPDTRADSATSDAIVEEDLQDGEACVSDIQCASGTCLTDEDGFPGGFCTTTGCESRRDCSGASRACLRGEFNGNLCVELCTWDDDCREGYECVGESTGSYCYPAFAGDALHPICETEFLVAEDVDAGFFGGWGSWSKLDRHRIEFDIEEGTTAFTVVAWDRSYALMPDRLGPPGAAAFDLADYGAYLYTPSTLGNIAPMLFPGGPDWTDLVAGGHYTMEYGYQGEPDDHFCFLVLQDRESLDRDGEMLEVDMNFYFVGVPGLSADIAERDSDFLAMLDSFDRVYDEVGVRLGEVRYFDVVGDVEEEFAVITTQDQAFELVRMSRQPGSTRRHLLSANVFFIQGFAGREMSSVLGISTGIPGVPGIHGQQGTGLVFSAEYLGGNGGNRLVGQVLAHELGHFLGLFHTTETTGTGTDQLEDTPECRSIGDGDLAACPDFDNLMFPIAAYRDALTLSDGQAMIMRANPLTRLGGDEGGQ